MNHYAKKLLVAALFLALTGCIDSAQMQELEQAAEELGKVAEQMEESGSSNPEDLKEAIGNFGKALSGEDARDPVNFRELAKFVPESLPGMELVDKKGENNNAMGISMSTVERRFGNDDRDRMTITVNDLGSLSGIAALGYSWAMISIDKETMNGFERTGKYGDYPMLEKYDSKSERGSIVVLVDKRFAVEVEGSSVEWDAIQDALDRVDMKGLVRLD